WVGTPSDGTFYVSQGPDTSDDWISTVGYLSGFEYRRFEPDAKPVWLPLRMPGQYYDPETDLFENWNRFYDASVGRYSAPEPMMIDPGWVMERVKAGGGVHVYAYVGNAPTAAVDPDGLSINYLDKYGERLSASSSSEDLMAMAKAMAAVDVLATSKDASVSQVVSSMRDSTQYSVDIYVNIPTTGTLGRTSPGGMGSEVVMKETEKIGEAIGGAGWNSKGQWGWVGIANNFEGTLTHELGHAAFHFGRWQAGLPILTRSPMSNEMATRFHNAYVQDPRAVPVSPYRPGGMPLAWGHP
ncbi:RHS repeat-associated core domain-containing protein, partial [Corallococcus coralloides]|nr:RHS repeat-associated core domain-containing protein [Corallococcus coralloides]